MLEKFEHLRKFVLKCKFESAISNSERFKQICGNLKKNKTTMARLLFMRAVCSYLEHFPRFYQVSEPAIHMLHDEITELLRCFLFRFVKEDLICSKSARHVIQVQLTNDACLPAHQFDMGQEARQIMKVLKADKLRYPSYKLVCLDMRKFFEASANYVVKKLTLQCFTKEPRMSKFITAPSATISSDAVSCC